MVKMNQPQRTLSTDSTADAIRKRVCKACDRCRLKKSKCDGSNPCSRCKTDNAICVFGERKRSHDKIYPKGYVEMLEQQQGQLVSGLQEMYRRIGNGQRWPGPKLEETNGNPLTHDILAALNLLETKDDGSGEFETFEEDFQTLQSKLIAGGASYTRRRGSLSSDSEHSHQGNAKSTSQSTPTFTRPSGFNENFNFSNASTPLTRSPVPRQRQSYPPTHHSPLAQGSPPSADPQLFQPEWAMPNPQSIMKSNFALQAPQLQQGLGNVEDLMDTMQWGDSPISYDLDMSEMASYSQQMQYGLMNGVQDYGFSTENIENEFHRYIQVST